MLRQQLHLQLFSLLILELIFLLQAVQLLLSPEPIFRLQVVQLPLSPGLTSLQRAFLLQLSPMPIIELLFFLTQPF